MIKDQANDLLAIHIFGHDMPACKKYLDDPAPSTLTERETEVLTVRSSDQREVVPEAALTVPGVKITEITVYIWNGKITYGKIWKNMGK